MQRLFFATDIHGSEICWKKFLGAAAYYEADIIVLGGDMTGKALVPIVKTSAGRWRSVLLQQVYELESESAVKEIEAAISSRGYYPFRTDEAAMEAFMADSSSIDELFMKRVLETLEGWIEFADRKLGSAPTRCFVCPGNDDAFEIDELLASSERVVVAEGKAIDLGEGFTMASTGWSNHTPWMTHREEDEPELYDRILRTIPSSADCSRWIFNLHAPPFSSGLDDAPELDAQLNVKNAGQTMVPVGSKSVRRIIEERKPLLSLHGHIHEAKGVARIGKSLCLNPGSLYEQGVLQGAIIDLDPRKGIRSYVLTTG
jgi:Icc-related predicted phosphoesterase